MHKPVMLKDVVELLAISNGGTYIDGTLGEGNHAQAILNKIGTNGRLLGVDWDDQALAIAKGHLSSEMQRCFFEHGNFADLMEIASRREIRSVDGILLDLGMSSLQVTAAERGFSFMKSGPLDMRMDRSRKITAAYLIQTLNFGELTELIWEFGEERKAKKIASEIVRERKHCTEFTTRWLADLVIRVKGGRRGRIHPATRTFQAFRIAVNNELDNLSKGLEESIALLKHRGRLAVLSYHSLEDKVVKEHFLQHAGQWLSVPEGGKARFVQDPVIRLVNKKPLEPSRGEIAENPRARSAKLRVIERV